MSAWIMIAAVAVVTAVIKAAGPVVLGGRELPQRFTAVISLLAAPLIAALVVTACLADGQRLQADVSTAGVAVGGALLWRGAPVLVGVLTAVAVTAGLRLLGVP